MNRLNRFFAGLVSGYAELAANFLYTIVSIPIALHFLSKEQFGLWALVLQFSTFFSFFDFGFSSSVTRLLANYKDRLNDLEYRAVFQTGRILFLIQGFLVFFASLLLALLAPPFLGLTCSLVEPFKILIIAQGVFYSFVCFFRPCSCVLLASMRQDIIHWSNTLNFIVSLIVLFFSLVLKMGVFSLIFSSFVGIFCSLVFPWFFAGRLCLIPTNLKGLSFSFSRFLKLLRFAKDACIIQLGMLLSAGTQIILITRYLGLEEAANFAVGIKLFSLFQQILMRLFNNAVPSLTDIFVKGEIGRFVFRFNQIVYGSAILAIPAVVFLFCANTLCISFWTSENVIWGSQEDMLLGCLLFISLVSRCYIGVFGILGDYKPVKFFPLIEGILFWFFVSLMGSRLTVFGVLCISLCLHFLITCTPAWLALKKRLGATNFSEFVFLLIVLVLIVGQSFCFSYFSYWIFFTLSCISIPFWIFLLAFFCLPKGFSRQVFYDLKKFFVKLHFF